MELHVEREAGVTVVIPGTDGTTRLDSFNSSAFELAMRELIDKSEGDIILDLNLVSYISSGGLRVVLIAAKELLERNREFRVCALRRPVHEVFTIVGFEVALEICADRAEAIESLNNP